MSDAGRLCLLMPDLHIPARAMRFNLQNELRAVPNGIAYFEIQLGKRPMCGGWLHTGDMVYKDCDGYYYLVDRKKDVIIVGGENVCPVQLENFLRQFEFVKDAAVIGIPNPRMGESVAVIIELKSGYRCSKSEIRKLCSELPEYQRPLRILFDDIIRNTTGKINRAAMRARYLSSREKKQ